ncbi:aldo/keto reductase [Falsiroseomonas selenitidurans]|uniref:Aldo/keto reductase n=1 Tax=Falsiroseomonas selenitidurans TaxID=2716335 RepID=A0ABX1DXY6_9PROT|nr:aldo/keto reductase [Falsiroseomonas selenitidurans]NKC29736.1 aldo/keto reductase [Falsiroseomonas selenitidurans]
MEQRRLGRTGLSVSVLGYGCGAIGGLMVRGSAAEQDQAIGRALDHGITYFDTAPAYGDGASERNLGRALRSLRASPAIGTKVRIQPAERGTIAATIARSLEASLQRLGRDSVDLLQLHNPVTRVGEVPAFTPAQILDQAVPALQRLVQQGRIRWYGLTGIGEAPALRQVLEEGGFATAQMPCNLLNPSGVAPLPAGSAMPDLGQVIGHAAAADVGVMAIRVLAGGALSGSEVRGVHAAPTLSPIGSGASYAADVAFARRLLPLVQDGHAAGLVELALRFVIGLPGIATALVGTTSVAELDHAAASIAKGPLPEVTQAMLAALQP